MPVSPEDQAAGASPHVVAWTLAPRSSGRTAVPQVQCRPLSPRNEGRQKAIRIKLLLKENPALCRDLYAFLG